MPGIPFLFIASESVHVVSLQAQKPPAPSMPEKMAVATKTTTPGMCGTVNNGTSVHIFVAMFFHQNIV